MIIDAHDLEANQKLQCDLCIIGAGAAGITIAREFIGQNINVCVLEAGTIEHSDAGQTLYEGKNLGLPYDDLDICRLRQFGGSTQHWTGWCTALNAIDFEPRPWVPHSGWPIGLQDVEPYYQRAHPVLELGPYGYEETDWKGHGFATLGVDLAKLRQRFWQFSPPTRFGDVYGPELDAAANIQVVLNANVTNIQVADDGNAITNVEFRTFTGGPVQVTARQYVLACGGIENARLLLAANDVQKNGLGNGNDLVGRFFMAHPLAPAGIIVSADPQPIIAALGSRAFANAQALGGLHPSTELQEQAQILNASVLLDFIEDPESGILAARDIRGDIEKGKFPDNLGRNLWRVIRDIDEVVVGMWNRYTKGHDAFGAGAQIAFKLSLEHAPSPDNRVILIDEKDALGMPRVGLDLHLSDLHRHTSRVMAEAVGAELGRLGLGRLQLAEWLRDGGDDISEQIEWHYHHLGTTRMSDDPKTGVVNTDCRMHGIQNLYIAGSSVFPCGGYANPTLTIVALAIRLADHLKKELG